MRAGVVSLPFRGKEGQSSKRQDPRVPRDHVSVVAGTRFGGFCDADTTAGKGGGGFDCPTVGAPDLHASFSHLVGLIPYCWLLVFGSCPRRSS